MPTIIRNVSGFTVTLPPSYSDPLIGPGGSRIVNETEDEVIAILGGAARVREMDLIVEAAQSGDVADTLKTGPDAAPGFGVVYQPGDPAGSRENIYVTWDEVMAAIAGIPGKKWICFNDNFAPFDADVGGRACVIPAGTHPMGGVTWTSSIDVTGQPFFTISAILNIVIEDGCKLPGLRSMQFYNGPTSVLSRLSAPAVDDFNFGPDIMTLDSAGAFLLFRAKTATAPMIKVGGTFPFNFGIINCGRGVSFGAETIEDVNLPGTADAPVLEVSASAGTAICLLRGGGINGFAKDSVTGDGLIIPNTLASFDTNAWALTAVEQTTFSGTVNRSLPQYEARLRFARMIEDDPATTGPLPADTPTRYYNQHIEMNGFAGDLPLLGTSGNEGRQMFLEGPGSVDAAGSDTIGNASATSYTLGDGEEAVLFSDDSSQWKKLGLKKWSPPEKWFQDDVAASQTDVALGARVSGLFADIKMERAGSIVGLSSRLNAAVTAGTATVTVTVNGSAGTLAVVSTIGSNASGGEALQAAGVDEFVAGDLVGIQITTDVGFTPVTTDLEAWLSVATA